MAKFGFDERRLLNISEVEFGNDVAITPASGRFALYFDGGLLKRKNDAGSVVVFVEDGINLAGADVVSATNPQYSIFTTKDASGNVMQFRSIGSSDGTINMVMSGDVIDLTVDLSDINDELDHGLLLGLSDDDHAQYLLLAGRSGGQIANGGTAASDDLELRSTSDSTKGIVKIVDGSKFQFGKRIELEATLQTSTAAAASIPGSSVALSDNRVYSYKATILARRSSGGEDRAMYVLQGLFYRAGTGAVQQGPTKQEVKFESTGSWDANLVVAGNNVVIDVNGEASDTVEWLAQVEYVELASA